MVVRVVESTQLLHSYLEVLSYDFDYHEKLKPRGDRGLPAATEIKPILQELHNL